MDWMVSVDEEEDCSRQLEQHHGSFVGRAVSRFVAQMLRHFTFWNSLSLRVKTETKRLNFGLSPELKLTNHRSVYHCSLHNVIADVIADFGVFLCLFMNKRKSEVNFVHQNLISN